MKLYDKLKNRLKEAQQPLSQGEKAFKGLHNPVDHTNLVPGVTDQEHVFNGVPQRKDPKSASYEGGSSRKAYDSTLTRDDAAKNAGYDSTVGLNREEVESVDEGSAENKIKKNVVVSRMGSKHRDAWHMGGKRAPDGSGRLISTQQGDKIRGRELSQGKVREEVESVEEEKNQYIEVKNKHTGAVRHIEVHPSRAFEALNKYKDMNHHARIVSKKPEKYSPPVKEDAEQVDEVLTKKTPIGTWISDFVHSKNPKFAGKSKKDRMKQAMAAYYAKQRNEAVGEDDWEGFMAKTELNAIADKAKKMADMIDEHEELEAWVQSKISYAKMQIDGVFDYMTYSGVNEEAIVEKKGDDEDESDRAANKNIVNQMRKAPVDGMHKITFENGKKHMIEPKHVAKALEVHANTPVAKGAREAVQNALAHSHEHFMHVVKHGKPPVQAAKPKVSLGSMKREEIEVNEKLIGNQKKIDANHNGRIDGQDFKLLRMRKKKVQEAEEMTAANVAKAAATQTEFGSVGDRNMQQDSVDKMKSDPLASKVKIKLPPTQGNKPIGGDTQTHPNVAESLANVSEEQIDALDRLFDTLSEENREYFRDMVKTEEGIDYLLNFVEEQGI